MILERLVGELPSWAKATNPLLRYEVYRNRPLQSRRASVVRISGWVVFLAMLLLGGYAYATGGFQRGIQLPYTMDLWRILFFPVLFLQAILRIAGMSFGATAIIGERRQQRWDNLRATEFGAEISLRSRWVFILFYKLRILLFVILSARFVLLLGILYELTSMQGSYLDILSSRSLSPLPLEVSIVLLAAFMSALLLLPITATGIDIALGLLVATTIRNRAFAGALQVIWVWFNVLLVGWLFFMMQRIMNGTIELDAFPSVLVVGAFATIGDWGLTLSQLSQTGDLWAQIPYTIYVGGFLFLYTIVQIMVTAGLLSCTVRIAERRE